MGGVAKTVTNAAARAGAAVITGGLSETSVGKKILKPVSDIGATIATGGLSKIAAVSSPGEPVPDFAGQAAGTVAATTKDQITKTTEAALADTEDPFDRIKKRSKTLLTGGLGVSDAAPVVRKTLLGGSK